MTHATSIINQRIQEMSLDYLKLVCTNHNINISDQNLQIILYLIKNNSCTVIIPDYHPIIYIEIYNKFEKKHKLQIKLINKLPNINLNNTNEDFINIIKEYEDYLGPERVLAMCNLLEERLDYVRELYTNV